jgi:hypothetical protein
MRTGHCGNPLSIKGGPGHGREGCSKEKRGDESLEEKIGGRTTEKLVFREKSVETYKIYIL